MRSTACLFAVLFATRVYAQQAAPKPLVKTPVAPVRVVHREDGVYFIDFGRAAFAQFKLPLKVRADEKITVRLGEKLSAPDRLDAKPGGSIRFVETTITNGQATLPKRDARLMPDRVGPVMPFRYAELIGLPEGTSPDELAKLASQVAVTYPFNDAAADFTSSDKTLNAVWDLCEYSIKATSFAGIFVDGDRERKPYEADSYINGLGWFCTTDDLTLPPFTDRYLIDHPTWPTEWSMFSVLCAWNNYLYTADSAALRKAYPDLKAKSLLALAREDGLISTANVPPAVYQALHLKEKLRDIVDWPVTERDGYELLPINTVVNAFHCRSLQQLADMATALNLPSEAKTLRAAADRAIASLNDKLVDKTTGLYTDGEGSTHSSQHANMFPLAFGLVPADRRQKVTDYVKGRGMACSVYGAQFLMDALFDNGAGDDAVSLMLAPGERSWRHMVEDTGTTIALEAWDQKFKPNQDWNHAWGAAPANLIPRKVLGVEPLKPGFTRVLVWPRCAGKSGTLTSARGKVPTIKGPVAVDWNASAKGFRLTVDLPAGTTGQVRLPPDWGNKVSLDNAPVDATPAEGSLAIEVTSGKHVITIGE